MYFLSSMIVQSFITLKWQEKKVINNKNFQIFFFDHLNTDEGLSSTECPFTCKSAMLERTHHYLL